MTMRRAFLVTAAVLATGAFGLHGAEAQTAAKPKAEVVTAAARTSIQANKWACASRDSVQIAQLSADVETGKQFVLVHLRNGEAVSSERISAADAEAIRNLDCKGERQLAGATASVGG